LSIDSSIENDARKKLTVMIFLFPDDLEIKKRKVKIFWKNDNINNELEITSPLTFVIFKTRKFAYQLSKLDFPYIFIF